MAGHSRGSVPPGYERLTPGAAPDVDPSSRKGPEDRGWRESDELAREAGEAWREIMGPRRRQQGEGEDEKRSRFL